ncbi:MAG: SoxR reducing system RseC family protein [Bacteroidales bacterium]|nr:SoxR reducing system RseC family protein [Bacteroidales bacterium]
MSNGVSHDGIVKDIQGRMVTVQFVQSSACSGCHAKHLCTSGESKSREVIAECWGHSFQVGDAVTISVSHQLARRAMWYAFGLPVVLLVLALFPLIAWVGDLGACAGEIILLSIYYTIFYFMRNKLEKQVCFVVRPRYS